MRFNLREGYLVVHRNGRVTQYRLPSQMRVVYGFVGAILLYLMLHPLVGCLLVQSAVDLDPGKAVAATGLAVGKISTDFKNALMVTRPPRASQLPTLHMVLPKNTLLKMQRALAAGDSKLGHDAGGTKPYFKALLESDVSAQEIKVCLRGKMNWHHRPEKPSFRIKIKKSNLTGGDRYVELTTPEDPLVLKNWLPNQLGQELGLMSDQSEPVRLFVNDKYFGVYTRSARQGEPFALANQRMPGTFFKGEFSKEMWSSAGAWKMFGQQDPEDVAAVQRWIDLLALPQTAGTLEEFETVFDTEMFARWAALMTVVGSIHTDDRHNHSYFFCANQGKLEPLPWDCNGYGIHTEPNSPVDTEVNPVQQLMIANPRWVHRRNQLIHQLIHQSGSLAATTQTINDVFEKMKADLEADQHLGSIKNFSNNGWHWIPTSVAELQSQKSELLAWIKARNAFLLGYLNNAKVAIDYEFSDSNSAGCRVVVFGSTAVKARNVDTGVQRILYPGLSEQDTIQYPFVLPTNMAYQLDANPSQLEFFNAINGEPVSELPMPGSERKFSTARTIPEDQFGREQVGDVILGPGNIDIENDMIVGPHQRLIVRPGTQLSIGAGVGIYSRGQTLFQGTVAQPITVRGSSEYPWAAIGIAGAKTAGSVFEFVDVEGGSIGRLDHLRFKGMLSVYDCPNIKLRNCSVGQNFVGDDAVNLAESKIRVEQCTWHNAKADALDLDMCTGEVNNCQWFNSGNDGLDLMSCDLKVTDCYFEGSGDKGISVGENTRLRAERVRIVNCLVGTEVKDDSAAQYVDSVFERCGTAVHSYQKKWFYSGGGKSALVDCEVVGSTDHDIEMKAKSNILLVRTTIESSAPKPELPKWQKRVRSLDAIPDDWKETMQPSRYRTH